MGEFWTELRGVCVACHFCKEEPMLKLPPCGFAKRVDDTVARAMAILRNREDHTAKKPLSITETKPQK
jgi:hypothetical protein